MAGEWRRTTVGEFAPFAYGKGLPEAKRNQSGSFPVYGSNGIVGWHDAPLTEGASVIIGRKGTVGALHYSPVPCWPIDTTFFVSGSEPILVRFHYYLLKALGLEHMNTDSAVPGLNRGAAHARVFDVPLAEVEQRRIAHILGTLDDKIENNRKTAKTIEAMAQAIFKSWFVDFDPVRAKASGESTESICKRLKITPEILSLFPDGFEDSELGKIPSGWKVDLLGSHIINHDAKRIPISGDQRKKRFGAYPYYGATGILDYIDDYIFDGAYTLVAEDGTVINSDETAVTQYISGKFWVSNHAHVIQGKHPISTEYLLLYFRHEPITAYVTGAVQLKLSQGRMNAMPFLYAGSDISAAFEKLAKPLFNYLTHLYDSSRKITDIRDDILPKLLTGEIRVAF